MSEYDLVIIGAGAAGSEAAFSIADGGRRRILVAECEQFGGTCTNWGCVPTKALVRSAKIVHAARTGNEFGVQVSGVRVDWPRAIRRAWELRDRMLRQGAAPFREAGIDVRIPARAVFTGERELAVNGERVRARAVVVAAGLGPATPPIPGLAEAGCLDNRGVLSLPELPRRLGVVGAGPIGSEFAQIFARFGVQVTVLEAADHVLPAEETETGQAVKEALAADGVDVRTSVSIESVERKAGGRRLHLAGGEWVEVDEILVATGRVLDGEGLGLDAAGIEWSPQGIAVDDRLRTSRPWAWAAGDVVGDLLFTHVADAMAGVAARNALLGTEERIDLRVMPRVTFTDPEAASVGLTESGAREAGHDVKVGFAPLADAEKAQIDGQTIGHVKVIADARTGEMLGCHMVAETAGDMIHEAVVLMAARTPVKVGADAIHAYPTLSQLMRTALGRAALG